MRSPFAPVLIVALGAAGCGASPAGVTARIESHEPAIERTLSERAGVPVRLRYAIVEPRADGASSVIGLYALSRYELCLRDPAAAAPEGEDAAGVVDDYRFEHAHAVCECDELRDVRVEEGCVVCACAGGDRPPVAGECHSGERFERASLEHVCRRIGAHAAIGHPSEDYELTDCDHLRVFHAVVGASGEVRAIHEGPVHGCALLAVEELGYRDVDGDGAREIIVRARTSTPHFAVTGDDSPGDEHFFGVYREDGTPELARVIADTASCGMNELGEGRAERVSFADEDGDGHPDLVIDAIEFSCEACAYGSSGFPDEVTSCGSAPERSVRRYDPERDTWAEP